MASEDLDREYKALFYEMFRAWQAAPPPPPLRLQRINLAAGAKADAVVIIHGWTARVLRTGQAALLLDANSYKVEASPLVRSMIEHSIALVWVEDKRGDAVQALIRKRSKFAERVQDAQERGWSLSPDVQAFVERAAKAETDEGTRYVDDLMHTAHQASTYGLGTLYQAWLFESDHSHPSIGSSLPYFDPWSDANEGSINLRDTPRDTGSEVSASVALVSYVALQSYSRLIATGDLSDHMGRWFERLEALNSDLHEEHASDS